MTAASTEQLLPLPCGPAPDGDDVPFWEALRNGELRLPRCAACQTWRPPGHPICSSCWSFELEWAEVAARGTVFSWIRTHRDFMEELDVRAPYVTVLVELDEAPVRLLGLLADDDAGPAIGDPVVGLPQQPANAAWPILRWFRAEEGGR